MKVTNNITIIEYMEENTKDRSKLKWFNIQTYYSFLVIKDI